MAQMLELMHCNVSSKLYKYKNPTLKQIEKM